MPVLQAGESSDPTASDEDVASWISWFCSLKGNEFFCEVEEDFISDDFNLSGLSSQVQNSAGSPWYDWCQLSSSFNKSRSDGALAVSTDE